MANEDDQNVSLSVPIGAAVGAVILLSAAAAAYVLLGRSGGAVGSLPSEAAQSGRSWFRRIGLMGIITLIENDASRKVVVAILKAIARRA